MACLPKKSPRPIFTLPFFDMVVLLFRPCARRGVTLLAVGVERDTEKCAPDKKKKKQGYAGPHRALARYVAP